MSFAIKRNKFSGKEKGMSDFRALDEYLNEVVKEGPSGCGCIVTRDGSASLDGVAQDASTPVTFESDILAFLRDLFGWS